MKTIDKIITKVDCSRGAPMGRPNVGHVLETMGQKKYDCAVPMISSGYDKGGAYWGWGGGQLRVTYTKDLKYICFYRQTY